MLEVKDLSVAYGRVEALRGANLAVGAGRIVTVIGPNGAGKTTLLNAIMGLLPGRGTIAFDGAPLGDLHTEARVALGLVLVPERRELFAEMSVADNLALGAFARYRKGARGLAEDREEIYRRFPRLRERADQLAGTLSGGERQMLALASAIVCAPRLLLIDELSLGLAPVIVEEIAGRLREIRDDLNLTVLLVEQSAAVAFRLADNAYVLEHGEVALSGSSVELQGNSAVQGAYLGTGAEGRRSYRDARRLREGGAA